MTALAPAGGWLADDPSFRETLTFFRTMQGLLQAAAPRADEILSTAEGRRRATEFTTVNFEHLPIRPARPADARAPRPARRRSR